MPRLIFEQIDDTTFSKIQKQIIDSVTTYIPEITLTNVQINPNPDSNSIYINVEYKIILSGVKDNIIIDFSTLQ